MAGVCARVNEFLEALRKLMAFLEHGEPGRRGRMAAAKVADRDVKAAVLRDVDGLTYREIGKELGVPPPGDFVYKGDHPTVRKMVVRGRSILTEALGEKGWQSQVEAMRAEAERWSSLEAAEQEAEIEAQAPKIPYGEALRHRAEKEACLQESGGEPGIA